MGYICLGLVETSRLKVFDAKSHTNSKRRCLPGPVFGMQPSGASLADDDYLGAEYRRSMSAVKILDMKIENRLFNARI